MVEVFRQAHEGRLALTDSMLVGNTFHSIVDGSPYQLDVSEDSDSALYGQLGRRVAIVDLVRAMITVSSNLATNILIARVDADSVMATLKRLGAPDMQVLRGVEDLKAYERGLNNTTNAVDMLRVMSALARDEVVSPAACREMRAILLAQQFNDKIPARLPPEVKVAHKTGWVPGLVEHDCAIVTLTDGRAYALVVLTGGIDDHSAAATLIADLSWIVYEVFNGK